MRQGAGRGRLRSNRPHTGAELASFFFAHDALCKRLERWQIAFRNFPQKTGIDAMVGMTKPIAESRHPGPIDLTFLSFDLRRDSARRLADDLEGSFDGESRNKSPSNSLAVLPFKKDWMLFIAWRIWTRRSASVGGTLKYLD